jgi:hypothetical protein
MGFFSIYSWIYDIKDKLLDLMAVLERFEGVKLMLETNYIDYLINRICFRRIVGFLFLLLAMM